MLNFQVFEHLWEVNNDIITFFPEKCHCRCLFGTKLRFPVIPKNLAHYPIISGEIF